MNLSTLQALFSTISKPLLGLEYLIFIQNQNENEKDKSYVCTLCTKHGNFLNIVQHIKSAKHIIKFLRTNFSTIADSFNFPLFMCLREPDSGFLNLVGTEVEKIFGRKTPAIVSIHKPEEKWKFCLSHFNGALLNRTKPEHKITRNLIANIQKKQKALKSLKNTSKEEELSETKPKRERSRSPLSENNRRRRCRKEKRSHRDRSTDNECLSTMERYHREYNSKKQSIRHRYTKYDEVPESHPKYTETWNFYWLEEFYKLDEKTRDASKCDFTPNWRGYWEKRSLELQVEEELEMRVKLRERMELDVDPEDKVKLKMIIDRSKVMIKEKSPNVPIITSNGLKDVKVPSMIHHVTTENKKLAIKEDLEKIPAHIKTLTNNDLVVLFGNINKLSEDLRDELVDFMNLLEMKEPERYRDLLSVCLLNEDVEQVPTNNSHSLQQVQVVVKIDSEASYTLEEVLASAQENLKYGPALTPERYDESSIIDLTSD